MENGLVQHNPYEALLIRRRALEWGVPFAFVFLLHLVHVVARCNSGEHGFLWKWCVLRLMLALLRIPLWRRLHRSCQQLAQESSAERLAQELEASLQSAASRMNVLLQNFYIVWLVLTTILLHPWAYAMVVDFHEEDEDETHFAELVLMHCYFCWGGLMLQGCFMSWYLAAILDDETLDRGQNALINRFTETRGAKPTDEGTDCAICLDDLRNGDQTLREMRCGHAYHQQCIDPWLRRHRGESRCLVCLKLWHDEPGPPAVSDSASDDSTESALDAEEGEESGDSRSSASAGESEWDWASSAEERSEESEEAEELEGDEWEVSDGGHEESEEDVEESEESGESDEPEGSDFSG
eukprot:TRINITY_DN65092_c0_g1_i1.p1 TRINITY_DN65092_c0_g1~~TRINITY_DN65092_c0_g1_i1.p1  ORF type:complete len:376 (+),score=72.97 TRINITY_DN65092_c0_g1_i1:70-1128(+)